MRCRNRAGIQHDGDSSFFHLLSCELTKGRCNFWQNLGLGVDDRDDYVLFAEVVVKAAAAANQLIDFSGKLYTAEAGSDNDEAKMPTPAIGVSSSLGMLHLVDDMLAQIDGIAHDLEAKRVIGHSGDDAQVALGTTRNDDMVVVQARQRTGSIVKLNLRRTKIYSLHSLRATADGRKHLAQGGRRSVRIDGGSRDIG